MAAKVYLGLFILMFGSNTEGDLLNGLTCLIASKKPLISTMLLVRCNFKPASDDPNDYFGIPITGNHYKNDFFQNFHLILPH
jgi:hypothetical protein